MEPQERPRTTRTTGPSTALAKTAFGVAVPCAARRDRAHRVPCVQAGCVAARAAREKSAQGMPTTVA